MHTLASAHFLGDTSDVVTINVVRTGDRTGGSNRLLWSLRVCPTLCSVSTVHMVVDRRAPASSSRCSLACGGTWGSRVAGL